MQHYLTQKRNVPTLQALTTIQSILDMLAPSIGHMPGAAAAGRQAVRAAGELVPMLPELLPGVRHMMELFLRQLLRRMALRLAEDLQPATTGSAGAFDQVSVTNRAGSRVCDAHHAHHHTGSGQKKADAMQVSSIGHVHELQLRLSAALAASHSAMSLPLDGARPTSRGHDQA